MMTRRLRCLLLVSGWMLLAPSWAEEPLVVAPATSQVDISTDFSGADVKAVGAISGPGELIIKLVGPKQEATLSRETKLGPFWVEGDRVKMEDAPSLLFLYATAPIVSILPPAEQQKYGLVLEGVPVRIEPQLQGHAADDWRKAFFRLKEKQGYYHEYDRAIRVFGNRLFIADMRLPGDLQIGTYTIETLLVNSGKVVGHTAGDFKVRLSGIERLVWNAAHDYPWSFGSLFTLLAMLLGLALNAIPYRRTR
ncbi:MAG: TIGR02186 family protein [Betaproteobacteria bacterium]|nr:TIGR02186 family protein [Betaproteobacteria bacterium]